jgi:hypothetical protein
MSLLVTHQTDPCVVCGERTTVALERIKLVRWQRGEFVQTVWPDMPIDDRELLISGTHPACWETLMEGED